MVLSELGNGSSGVHHPSLPANTRIHVIMCVNSTTLGSVVLILPGDRRPALAPLQEPMAWFGGGCEGVSPEPGPVQCSVFFVPVVCSLPNCGMRLGRQVGETPAVDAEERKWKSAFRCSEENQPAALLCYQPCSNPLRGGRGFGMPALAQREAPVTSVCQIIGMPHLPRGVPKLGPPPSPDIPRSSFLTRSECAMS